MAPAPGAADARRRRALLVALELNGAFLVVEVVGGIAFGSLALVADAAHMTSDVLALALALVAIRIARRPPTDRHTYGFVRAEVLAAQVNGVLLLAGAGAIAVEAVRRLDGDHAVSAAGVLGVGIAGLAVNVASAVVVGHAAHGDLNLRAAWWHLVADALGSVAVVVAAIGVLVFDVDGLDAVASLAIIVLVAVAAGRLLRDTTRVLLEGTPAGLDVGAVRAALVGVDGVEEVHDLHVWSLGADRAALSAHVVLAGPLSLHDAQVCAGALKSLLAERFDISHATLEVECHDCVDNGGAHTRH